jgi:hypothetical protein
MPAFSKKPLLSITFNDTDTANDYIKAITTHLEKLHSTYSHAENNYNSFIKNDTDKNRLITILTNNKNNLNPRNQWGYGYSASTSPLKISKDDITFVNNIWKDFYLDRLDRYYDKNNEDSTLKTRLTYLRFIVDENMDIISSVEGYVARRDELINRITKDPTIVKKYIELFHKSIVQEITDDKCITFYKPTNTATWIRSSSIENNITKNNFITCNICGALIPDISYLRITGTHVSKRRSIHVCALCLHSMQDAIQQNVNIIDPNIVKLHKKTTFINAL